MRTASYRPSFGLVLFFLFLLPTPFSLLRAEDEWKLRADRTGIMLQRWKEILVSKPFSSSAFQRLLSLSKSKGAKAKLLEDARREANAAPNSSPKAILLARLLLHFGKAQEALAIFQALPSEPSDKRPLLLAIASCHLQLKQKSEAIKVFRKALELLPKDASDPKKKLAKQILTLLLEHGNAESITAFSSTIESLPWKTSERLDIARLYQQNSRLQEARSHLLLLLPSMKGGEKVRLLLEISRIETSLASYPSALTRIKEARKLRSLQGWVEWEILNQETEILRRQKRLYTLILRLSEEWSKTKDLQKIMFLARLHRELKDEEKALTYAQKALQIQPSAREPRMWLVESYQKSGDHARASEEMRLLIKYQHAPYRYYFDLARAAITRSQIPLQPRWTPSSTESSGSYGAYGSYPSRRTYGRYPYHRYPARRYPPAGQNVALSPETVKRYVTTWETQRKTRWQNWLRYATPKQKADRQDALSLLSLAAKRFPTDWEALKEAELLLDQLGDPALAGSLRKKLLATTDADVYNLRYVQRLFLLTGEEASFLTLLKKRLRQPAATPSLGVQLASFALAPWEELTSSESPASVFSSDAKIKAWPSQICPSVRNLLSPLVKRDIAFRSSVAPLSPSSASTLAAEGSPSPSSPPSLPPTASSNLPTATAGSPPPIALTAPSPSSAETRLLTRLRLFSLLAHCGDTSSAVLTRLETLEKAFAEAEPSEEKRIELFLRHQLLPSLTRLLRAMDPSSLTPERLASLFRSSLRGPRSPSTASFLLSFLQTHLPEKPNLLWSLLDFLCTHQYSCTSLQSTFETLFQKNTSFSVETIGALSKAARFHFPKGKLLLWMQKIVNSHPNDLSLLQPMCEDPHLIPSSYYAFPYADRKTFAKFVVAVASRVLSMRPLPPANHARWTHIIQSILTSAALFDLRERDEMLQTLDDQIARWPTLYRHYILALFSNYAFRPKALQLFLRWSQKNHTPEDIRILSSILPHVAIHERETFLFEIAQNLEFAEQLTAFLQIPSTYLSPKVEILALRKLHKLQPMQLSLLLNLASKAHNEPSLQKELEISFGRYFQRLSPPATAASIEGLVRQCCGDEHDRAYVIAFLGWGSKRFGLAALWPSFTFLMSRLSSEQKRPLLRALSLQEGLSKEQRLSLAEQAASLRMPRTALRISKPLADASKASPDLLKRYASLLDQTQAFSEAFAVWKRYLQASSVRDHEAFFRREGERSLAAKKMHLATLALYRAFLVSPALSPAQEKDAIRSLLQKGQTIEAYARWLRSLGRQADVCLKAPEESHPNSAKIPQFLLSLQLPYKGPLFFYKTCAFLPEDAALQALLPSLKAHFALPSSPSSSIFVSADPSEPDPAFLAEARALSFRSLFASSPAKDIPFRVIDSDLLCSPSHTLDSSLMQPSLAGQAVPPPRPGGGLGRPGWSSQTLPYRPPPHALTFRPYASLPPGTSSAMAAALTSARCDTFRRVLGLGRTLASYSTWRTKDTDHDQIPDFIDQCPFTAGLTTPNYYQLHRPGSTLPFQLGCPYAIAGQASILGTKTEAIQGSPQTVLHLSQNVAFYPLSASLNHYAGVLLREIGSLGSFLPSSASLHLHVQFQPVLLPDSDPQHPNPPHSGGWGYYPHQPGKKRYRPYRPYRPSYYRRSLNSRQWTLQAQENLARLRIASLTRLLASVGWPSSRIRVHWLPPATAQNAPAYTNDLPAPTVFWQIKAQ